MWLSKYERGNLSFYASRKVNNLIGETDSNQPWTCHPHYWSWLLLYSLAGEQLIFPVSESSASWGPNPCFVGYHWDGAIWAAMGRDCLRRAPCTDAVASLIPCMLWSSSLKKEEGILELCSCSRTSNPQKPNQLISTKKLWCEGQGCPLPQGSSESICMWTPSCLYKGSLLQEKHEWWLTQPIKLFYNCTCKNGVI